MRLTSGRVEVRIAGLKLRLVENIDKSCAAPLWLVVSGHAPFNIRLFSGFYFIGWLQKIFKTKTRPLLGGRYEISFAYQKLILLAIIGFVSFCGWGVLFFRESFFAKYNPIHDFAHSLHAERTWLVFEAYVLFHHAETELIVVCVSVGLSVGVEAAEGACFAKPLMDNNKVLGGNVASVDIKFKHRNRSNVLVLAYDLETD